MQLSKVDFEPCNQLANECSCWAEDPCFISGPSGAPGSMAAPGQRDLLISEVLPTTSLARRNLRDPVEMSTS